MSCVTSCFVRHSPVADIEIPRSAEYSVELKYQERWFMQNRGVTISSYINQYNLIEKAPRWKLDERKPSNELAFEYLIDRFFLPIP